LDHSDPLNLLHNTSQCSSNASGDSSMEDLSQGDWSQLSNLWPSHLDSTNVTDKGKYPDLMDFDLSSLLP